MAQIRLRLAEKKVVSCRLSARQGPPKDFSGPAAAGGAYCTRALAADAEIRPKMAVVRKNRLGIRQLRVREQAQQSCCF